MICASATGNSPLSRALCYGSAQGRDRTWLDFGRRGSFTAVVVTRQAKAFERAGLVLSALAGARIRVRGAMDTRFGLRMAISGPEQIERLSQGVGTSEAKPGK